ncbi:MAG: GNAT family N-acetyltransferase [Desulfobulbaceae bacterium]|nr:MAG: GNAT family N-acetyltransferase [Desulfobulbaceae bacterium]
MYINLSAKTIEEEHICCAFSDKKCKESYQLKKAWLKDEFQNGYVFRRLNERAKVFIEYGPAEYAWVPVTAPNHLHIGCFWVSGRYKKQGHGKQLLADVLTDAKNRKKSGLITVVGKKKFHFMSDTKWLLSQGFEVIETSPNGFYLLCLPLTQNAPLPAFNSSVIDPRIPSQGCIAYFSNRCPYAEYHVLESLTETCRKREIPLQTIKFTTLQHAQSSPTPATIFSLFLDGKFVTTDISVCMDSKFDKIVSKK